MHSITAAALLVLLVARPVSCSNKHSSLRASGSRLEKVDEHPADLHRNLIFGNLFGGGGEPGPKGETGPEGPPGPQGPEGPAGANGVGLIRAISFPLEEGPYSLGFGPNTIGDCSSIPGAKLLYGTTSCGLTFFAADLNAPVDTVAGLLTTESGWQGGCVNIGSPAAFKCQNCAVWVFCTVA